MYNFFLWLSIPGRWPPRLSRIRKLFLERECFIHPILTRVRKCIVDGLISILSGTRTKRNLRSGWVYSPWNSSCDLDDHFPRFRGSVSLVMEPEGSDYRSIEVKCRLSYVMRHFFELLRHFRSDGRLLRYGYSRIFRFHRSTARIFLAYIQIRFLPVWQKISGVNIQVTKDRILFSIFLWMRYRLCYNRLLLVDHPYVIVITLKFDSKHRNTTKS